MVILLYAYSTQLVGQSFFDEADRFFNQFVKNGLVKYDLLKKERSSLDNLVEKIGAFNFESASDVEKKAFLINTYNILVIHHVMTNYPAEGPLKIDGFFNKLKAKVAGMDLTLDEIEKERLFRTFPDERLHFVLVCAAVGCPPLADFAFRPDGLEKQLSDRTTYVLNFPTFIRVTKNVVQVSKIFAWYEGDFLEKSESVLSYVDQYHTQNLIGKKLLYYEYDWRLNKY